MENSLVNINKEIFREVLRSGGNLQVAEDSLEFLGGMPEEIIAFENTPTAKRISALENERYAYLESLNFNDVKMLKIVLNIGQSQCIKKSLSPNVIYQNELARLNHNGWASEDIEIHEVTKFRSSLFVKRIKSGLAVLQISI